MRRSTNKVSWVEVVLGRAWPTLGKVPRRQSASAATCFWAQTVLTRHLEEEKHGKDRCGKPLRGRQRTCRCGLWRNERSWCTGPKLAGAQDGRWQNDSCERQLPRRCKKTLPRHSTEVFWQRWAKKHEIGELKEGIWFEPIKALLKTNPKRIWTTMYAVHARSWVINGARTRKKLYDRSWIDSRFSNCCHAEGAGKHRLYHRGE